MKKIFGLLIICLIVFGCTGTKEVKEQPEKEKTSETTEPNLPDYSLKELLDGFVFDLFNFTKGDGIPVVIEDPCLKGTKITTETGFYLKEQLLDTTSDLVTFLRGIPEDFKRSGLTILYYGEPFSYSIYPEYSIDSSGIFHLSAAVIDRRTGKVVRDGSISFDERVIEESVRKKKNRVSSYEEAAGAEIFSNYDEIKLTVKANIPNGAYISHGDKITFTVTSDTDCYIKVYNISRSGSISLMVPDYEYGPKENFLIKDTVFDPLGQTHELVVTNPVPGKLEVIHIVASTVQFDELRTWYNYKHWKSLREQENVTVKRGDYIYYFRSK